MNLLIEIKRHSTRRAGISVVEVLSAMVVAMIGVFGVMVLIPFAVQQAQSGLDRDAAATVGRNAFEQFEIEGFRYVDSNDQTRIVGSAGPVTVGANPGVGVIDPLSVTEIGFGTFCGFQTFNLRDTNNTAFSKAMARQMCRSADDLQFKSQVDNPPAGFVEALAPPQQIFDITGAGADARRQSLGRISWNSVLAPVKVDYANTPSGGTPGLTFRMHVLVHKDRDLASPAIVYPTAEVTPPDFKVGYGGGTVTLNGVLGDVRRDDWVMLNNKSSTIPGDPDSDYLNQVGFYRVTGVGKIKDLSGSEQTVLTLDGPDFNFGDPIPANHPLGIRPTTDLYHLVGFRNGRRSGQVVNVYERTMRWERKSNWN